jgi:flagellar protein FliS
MTPQAALRARYLSDSVTTASPARMLTMLYDRLVLDLTIGEQALLDRDRESASARLCHAQDIVHELRASLNPDLWSGGPGLAALYGHLLTELVQANVQCDAAKVAYVRSCVEPLRDAWHAAAEELAGP